MPRRTFTFFLFICQPDFVLPACTDGVQLFHQAILMSGSDLCEWSYVAPIWNANALTYSRDLGRLVGCGFDYDITDTAYLVRCLRGKHYEEIVNATASVYPRVRW